MLWSFFKHRQPSRSHAFQTTMPAECRYIFLTIAPSTCSTVQVGAFSTFYWSQTANLPGRMMGGDQSVCFCFQTFASMLEYQNLQKKFKKPYNYCADKKNSFKLNLKPRYKSVRIRFVISSMGELERRHAFISRRVTHIYMNTHEKGVCLNSCIWLISVYPWFLGRDTVFKLPKNF